MCEFGRFIPSQHINSEAKWQMRGQRCSVGVKHVNHRKWLLLCSLEDAKQFRAKKIKLTTETESQRNCGISSKNELVHFRSWTFWKYHFHGSHFTLLSTLSSPFFFFTPILLFAFLVPLIVLFVCTSSVALPYTSTWPLSPSSFHCQSRQHQQQVLRLGEVEK